MPLTVPTLTQNRLTGNGLTAALAVQHGAAFDVTSPDFGADPYGMIDSTAAIQAAINKAASTATPGTGGRVRIPAGTYKVSYPFLQLKGFVQIQGDGAGTRLFVDTSKPAPELTGVFHTGTYNERLQDSTCLRFGVRDLMIMTRTADNQHQDPAPNVAGIIYNTDLGGSPADPDAVPTLSDVEIWDMDIGAAIIGNDDQAMKVHNLRIRRTLRQGLIVGKPDNHPERIAKVPGGPGAADNKFIMADVSGANITGGPHAGIEIYTSQCKFVESTSWYNRRTRPWQDLYGLPTPALTQEGALAGEYTQMGAEKTAAASRNREWMHAGAGWFVKSTKNIFIGCTAQENGGHGWMLQWGKNQLIGCIGESSSYADTAKTGAARPQEAADFYVCNDAKDSLVLACRAESARGTAKGAAYGFHVETWISNLRIEMCQAQGHATGQALFVGEERRENVRVEVNGEFISTFLRDKKTAVETGVLESIVAPLVQEKLTQIEKKIESTVQAAITIGQHWGFKPGEHYYSPITYTWPDYYNGESSKWNRFLAFGNTLGLVILNRASGDWLSKRPDPDFQKQGRLALAAGAKKALFYVKTQYGAMAPEADDAYRERVRSTLGIGMEGVTKFTEDYIMQNLHACKEDYPDIFGGAFLDVCINAWDEQQKKILPWYRRLYERIKRELGQDTLVAINPGSNTRLEMMEACDIAVTYESDAQKYLDKSKTEIHPAHYDGVPSWRFWHIVHGVTPQNIEAVFDKADSISVGHLYVTDRKFSIGAGNEEAPEENPYDMPPREFVENRVKAWIRGVLPLEKRIAALEAALAARG